MNNSWRQTSVDNAGTPGVPTVTLSYGYDAYGNRTSLSDSLGGSISYTFDADHNLTGLALTANSVTSQVTFGYDAANRLTGITRMIPTIGGGGAAPDTGGGGGGNVPISTSLSYDNANRLTNILHTNGSTGATLASYTYGYDKASELTSYQDNNNSSLSYSYDANGELTGATGTLNGSSYSVSYDYDANGNRNMSGYQTGTDNELLNDGTYSYTYDKDGNLLTQTNISTGSVTYNTWDYRNRLTEVEEKTSNGTVIYDEKFTYDVNNNRIAVSLNGATQLYTVYDGANPYIDFNGSGSLAQRYLTNPQALSVFYGQQSASGATEWFLTDNINSIRLVVSTSGSVLDAITYDPYGNILNQTSSTYAPRFLYTGGAFDLNTGNYQFKERPYGPGDGRFETPDSKGFTAGDTNLYRYVGNSPVSNIDPSGLDGIVVGPNGVFVFNYKYGIIQASQGVLWGGSIAGAVAAGGGPFSILAGLPITLPPVNPAPLPGLLPGGYAPPLPVRRPNHPKNEPQPEPGDKAPEGGDASVENQQPFTPPPGADGSTPVGGGGGISRPPGGASPRYNPPKPMPTSKDRELADDINNYLDHLIKHPPQPVTPSK